MSEYLHQEFPKSVGKKEFWKQIKRTVNGKEVSENDIMMIVNAISSGLDFESDDNLLDLGCGNAALASRLFPSIDKYVGLDFSKYLLKVAKDNFHIKNKTSFKVFDLRKDKLRLSDNNITKVLIYGTISYLSKREVRGLLMNLRERLPNLKKIFIGNIPNVKYSSEFFSRRNLKNQKLNDPESVIGVWWEPEAFSKLMENIGFNVKIRTMPADFYGYKIRFDLVGST